MNSPFRDMVDSFKLAARGAATDIRRSVGRPAGRTLDPDLRLYRQLSPADFQQMSAQYGPDEVYRYILTMERRSMGGE